MLTLEQKLRDEEVKNANRAEKLVREAVEKAKREYGFPENIVEIKTLKLKGNELDSKYVRFLVVNNGDKPDYVRLSSIFEIAFRINKWENDIGLLTLNIASRNHADHKDSPNLNTSIPLGHVRRISIGDKPLPAETGEKINYTGKIVDFHSSEGWPADPQKRTLYVDRDSIGEDNRPKGYIWDGKEFKFLPRRKAQAEPGKYKDIVHYATFDEFPGNTLITQIKGMEDMNPVDRKSALYWANEHAKGQPGVLYIDDSTGRGYIWTNNNYTKGYTYVPKPAKKETDTRTVYAYTWVNDDIGNEKTVKKMDFNHEPKSEPSSIIKTEPAPIKTRPTIIKRNSNADAPKASPLNVKVNYGIWPALIKKEDAIIHKSREVFDVIKNNIATIRLRYGDKFKPETTIEVVGKKIKKQEINKEIIDKINKGTLTSNEKKFLRNLQNISKKEGTDTTILFAKGVLSTLPEDIKKKLEESRMNKNRIQESEGVLIPVLQRIFNTEDLTKEDIIELAKTLKNANFENITGEEASLLADILDKFKDNAAFEKIKDFCNQKIAAYMQECEKKKAARIQEASEEDPEEEIVEDISVNDLEGEPVEEDDEDIDINSEDLINTKEIRDGVEDEFISLCYAINDADTPSKQELLKFASLIAEIGLNRMTNEQYEAMLEVFEGRHWEYEPLQKIKSKVLDYLAKILG